MHYNQYSCETSCTLVNMLNNNQALFKYVLPKMQENSIERSRMMHLITLFNNYIIIPLLSCFLNLKLEERYVEN